MRSDNVILSQVDYMAMTQALRDAEERADALLMEADTDELTGLLNMRGLQRRIRDRHWGFFVAADLNGFKAAQDAPGRGHPYGDAILIEFAEFLLTNTRQREMRARDILASRSGGDEFMIWTETRAGARRIKEAIREWHSTDGLVTSSAGIGADTAAADAACYMNKQANKEA